MTKPCGRGRARARGGRRERSREVAAERRCGGVEDSGASLRVHPQRAFSIGRRMVRAEMSWQSSSSSAMYRRLSPLGLTVQFGRTLRGGAAGERKGAESERPETVPSGLQCSGGLRWIGPRQGAAHHAGTQRQWAAGRWCRLKAHPTGSFFPANPAFNVQPPLSSTTVGPDEAAAFPPRPYMIPSDFFTYSSVPAYPRIIRCRCPCPCQCVVSSGMARGACKGSRPSFSGFSTRLAPAKDRRDPNKNSAPAARVREARGALRRRFRSRRGRRGAGAQLFWLSEPATPPMVLVDGLRPFEADKTPVQGALS